jgi:hypothetical protein
MKKTPWFSFKQVPARVGVYQVGYAEKPGVSYADKKPVHYSKWNGDFWCITADTPKIADSFSNSRSTGIYEGRYDGWRGILK